MCNKAGLGAGNKQGKGDNEPPHFGPSNRIGQNGGSFASEAEAIVV